MLPMKLESLLDEFEEWVVKGRAKKIPYQEWRWLKTHSEDQVRVVRDGWGDLGIFSETRCKFLVKGWQYDDESLGTYLDHIYIHGFDNSGYNLWQEKYDRAAWQDTPKVVIDEKGLSIDGKNINEKIDEAAGFSINRKENDSMNLFKNFDFGSCSNDNVKMSMYGIAVKNATGTWVSYDPNSGNIIDVDILNFDAKYLYKMPVAIKDVAEGDVIIHNRKPMFVSKVEGSKILAIDPAAGEEKVVILTKSPFNFDFVTKIVNLFEGCFNTPSADNPFGNFLPLMLLNDDTSSTDNLLPLIFLNGGMDNTILRNPMMLYFLLDKDNNKNDLLPLLMMTNSFGTIKNNSVEE